jgi:hypothetical protein
MLAGELSPLGEAVLGSGVRDAYTTFSTFTFETIRLLEDGRIFEAVANVVVSVVTGWQLMRLAWPSSQLYQVNLPISVRVDLLRTATERQRVRGDHRHTGSNGREVGALAFTGCLFILGQSQEVTGALRGTE